MASYEQIARRLERLEGKSGSTRQGNGPERVIIVRYTEHWREVERVDPTIEAKIDAEVKALTQVMTTEAALVGYDKPYNLTIYACDDGEIIPEAPPWASLFPPHESSIIRLELALHNNELSPPARLLFEHTIEVFKRERDLAKDGRLPRWPARAQDWREKEQACEGAKERLLAKLQRMAERREGQENDA